MIRKQKMKRKNISHTPLWAQPLSQTIWNLVPSKVWDQVLDQQRSNKKGSTDSHKAQTEPKSVSPKVDKGSKKSVASVAQKSSDKIWANVSGRMVQMTRSEWVKTIVGNYNKNRVSGIKQVVDLTCKKLFHVTGAYVASRYKEVLEIASFMVGNLIQSNHKAQTVKSYDKNGIRFI
jgi:hypothetical protein